MSTRRQPGSGCIAIYICLFVAVLALGARRLFAGPLAHGGWVDAGGTQPQQMQPATTVPAAKELYTQEINDASV